MPRCKLPAAAATVLGLTALAAPAHAAVTGVDKAIIVTSNTSDVLLAGFGDNAAVSLVRDNVTVAKAVNKNDPAAAPPEGGINSAHVGALGGCWTTFTPELLPGDVIRVGADSTVVQGVTAEALSVVGDRMVTHGTAVTANGTRLPADEIDAQLHPPGLARFAGGSSGGQFLSAQGGDQGGIITYDSPSSTRWTARWPIPANVGDAALARESTVLGAWTGPAAAPANAGGEETDFEVGATPGPIASCDASPYRPNAAADHGAVNVATAAAALTLTGTAQPGVTGVTLKLTDAAGKAISTPAAVTGTTWAATFPGAQVAGLADGALTASGAYKIAAGTFHGRTTSIVKDTAAPAAPTSSVASGTYATAQQVSLGGEPGATVRYTTDGTAPTASSPAASGPIAIEASRSLKAIAVDAAGNPSAVSSFDYVIAPSLAAGGSGAAGRLRLVALRVDGRLRLRSARRRGIRVLLTAPSGAKVVRLRLLRGKRIVARVVRKVPASRLLSVTLPRTRKGRRHLKRGTYTVAVALGTSARDLGPAQVRRVRIR